MRSPYRKSDKLIPEDWDEEIRTEEERKLKRKNGATKRGLWILLMDEIKRQEEEKSGCKHKEKFWFQEHFHSCPQLLCRECFEILEERKILRNDVGYGFRNHIKNRRKAK